jgi:acetamidase/formamidase
VTDAGGIKYLSPEEAKLNWKVPLRPHLGTLGVMPNNTANYIDADAQGGASTIPPSRFGGNVDDWRIGKGGTMFYRVEVPGANLIVGDTHAAQGDSELAGTAMETSMTTKLRLTLHKADSLPKKVATVDFPLLETSDKFVVHGFAYSNYLDQLPDASTIFQEGASLDKAMADCFIKTRNWLMDVMDLTEEEVIALMSTAVDFGITQVVDGNWGVHADIDKWIFSDAETPYDYSCTTSKSGSRRRRGRSLLEKNTDRRLILEFHGITTDPDEYAAALYSKVVTAATCATSCTNAVGHRRVAERMLDAKLKFAKGRMMAENKF